MFSLPSASRTWLRSRNQNFLRRVTSLAVFSYLLLCGAAAQNGSALPQLTSAFRQGEFVSAVGRRAALLGDKTGGFEAWVYPLKILRGLQVRFHVEGKILPAEPFARTVIIRPESSTIVYGGDSFQIRETLFVPVRESGAIIMFEVKTKRPLEIEVAFTPDFQLEWPATMGPSQLAWDWDQHAFLFTANDHPYAALVGSPTASNPESEKRDTESAPEKSFLLGVTERGGQTKLLCIAASLRGREGASETYGRLLRNTNALVLEAENYYRGYLSQTLNLIVPDVEIQRAYDWARINLVQAVVDNPIVGTGLIAGYGPSGESQRPGFDWFFGRDALWTSLALDSEEDFADVRTELEFLAKYQRADGRIPHEIAQSAGLTHWFEDYPYGYASADATPLFLIVMNDYVQRSGDISFLSREWDSIWRAYQFQNSTLDIDGFAQNLGVGHGWVESGPLVPVRTEIYQAALGIEALRATSNLAGLLGKNEIAAELDERFERQRIRLNELFWSPQKNTFAFALDLKNARVDEPTVLPAVPMWFGLLDPVKAEQMIARLASPDLQTDWGLRILSSASSKYAADGYHFGSVWPLFTGWAAVGEYRYHRELAAYLNLRANALLALDESPGHITELLAGDRYKPLPTSTTQQIWSAAMIASPLLQGLLGLETNALAGEVVLKPHLPAGWGSFTVSNLHVGSTALALRFRRNADQIQLEITRTGSGKCALEFGPALSPRAQVAAVTLNGHAIPYRIERSDADQHASARFEVPLGKSLLRMRIQDDFGLGVTSQLPPPGSASRGLRILSQSWTADHDRLNLDLAGVPGSTYEFSLRNSSQLVSADGAELNKADPDAPKLLVRFPLGPGEYENRSITLHFVQSSAKGHLFEGTQRIQHRDHRDTEGSENRIDCRDKVIPSNATCLLRASIRSR